MLKRLAKIGGLVLGAGVVCLTGPGWAAQPSWEGEKLSLEMTMQRRVESALEKILPASSYVVVVRVEPWTDPTPPGRESRVEDPDYFLPGVPARRRLDGSTEVMRELVDTLRPEQQTFMRFVRRVEATLVLDQDLPEVQVEQVRDLTRQILGLDAARGDTLEVQRAFLSQRPAPALPESSISRFQRGLHSYWLIISLALIVFCITVFLLFIFGPLRGFLTRFVQVLPTLKPIQSEGTRATRFGGGVDPQFLQAMMAQMAGLMPPQGSASGGANPNFSGSLMVENPNKRISPFSFIREDHLSNLATLLSRENPEKAAVVLGYLPPEWISRILSKIEPQQQSEITEHLAVTRQLLPEQVEDIEQDLKRRLDYLIGGPERLLAVYESLDADGQRKMLENLKSARPELAEELRKHTFLFEDLERLDPNSMKIVFREIDLQTLMACLRGLSDTFREKILESLSAGKAEILREEIEFSDGPPNAVTFEAQRKISLLARRLEKEGQIHLPQVGAPATPAARYGGGLRDRLKLPDGFIPTSLAETDTAREAERPSMGPAGEAIEDRIRSFMNRQAEEKERFPLEPDKNIEPSAGSHDEE